MLETVRPYVHAINDGRTLHQVLDHLLLEVQEARDEIDGKGDGKDGITGEGIDILACALDFLILSDPTMTEERARAWLVEKCDKWVRKSKEGAYADRSPSTD